MKSLCLLLSMLLCCSVAIADDAVVQLSKQLGTTPALVVVVCAPGEGSLATVSGIVEQTPWKLFCRGGDSAGLDKIREWAAKKGLLGQRVSVVADEGDSLWLAADMADAVWVAPGVDYSRWEKEIRRVLHPGGVCVASGKTTVKPAVKNVDE